jgi:hypothetical protein
MSRESASRARYSEQITSSNYQTGRQGKAVRGETLNSATGPPTTMQLDSSILRTYILKRSYSSNVTRPRKSQMEPRRQCESLRSVAQVVDHQTKVPASALCVTRSLIPSEWLSLHAAYQRGYHPVSSSLFSPAPTPKSFHKSNKNYPNLPTSGQSTDTFRRNMLL